MNRFALRQVISVLSASGMLVLSSQAFASAFQLWEQDGASVGNYHAGYAAEANDASIAFYNPAGITRFKNQQLVFAAAGITTDFRYQGTIAVDSILSNLPRPVTAQGGNFNLVPSMHFVAPISDDVGFGFSVDVPFGLKTTYGRTTILRYAATTTATTVVDISPSLAYQLTNKASFGAGLDIQPMSAEFDQVGGMEYPTFEAEGINKKVKDTGYGYHLGALYQFTPDSRLGVSYHSQVVHHLNGISSFVGALANEFNGGPFSSQGYSNMTLPPYTALSVYHHFDSGFAIMASAIYTQWNILQKLVMTNISGIDAELNPSTNITVVIPEHFSNTWNLSIGADYELTDDIKIRGGLGYDQTPVSSAYRNVMLPDNNRIAVATGGHYQANKALGFDIGWTHFFMQQAVVHPPAQVTGAQIVTTNGHVDGGADVLSAQLTWDIV